MILKFKRGVRATAEIWGSVYTEIVLKARGLYETKQRDY